MFKLNLFLLIINTALAVANAVTGNILMAGFSASVAILSGVLLCLLRETQ